MTWGYIICLIGSSLLMPVLRLICAIKHMERNEDKNHTEVK